MGQRQRITSEQAEERAKVLNKLVEDLLDKRQFPHKTHLAQMMTDAGFPICPAHLSGGVGWAAKLTRIANDAQVKAVEMGLEPKHGRGSISIYARSDEDDEGEKVSRQTLQRRATVFRFEHEKRQYRVITFFENVTKACYYSSDDIAKFCLQKFDPYRHTWEHASYLSVAGYQRVRKNISGNFDAEKRAKQQAIAVAA
ncbi:MAG: hypothetical protein AAGB19_04695 [Cyanobacteria bacterium P01_F01_bin.3]